MWRDGDYLIRERAKRMPIAKKTLYLNADKTKAVPEGGEEAAYLLCREGCAVSDEDVEKYKVPVQKEGEKADDPNLVLSGTETSGQAVVEPDRSLDGGKQSAAKKR